MLDFLSRVTRTGLLSRLTWWKAPGLTRLRFNRTREQHNNDGRMLARGDSCSARPWRYVSELFEEQHVVRGEPLPCVSICYCCATVGHFMTLSV